MKFVVSLLISLALLAGCTSIPDKLESTTPSWDGSQRNSGFLGFTEDGQGVITPAARERFNGLAGRYGTNWTPTVVADAGLTPFTNGTWRIQQESLTKFATMNRWKREGR